MKSLFKVLVLLASCFVVMACGQSIIATSPTATSATTMTPIPSQTMVTATSFPSQTPTVTVEPTSKPEYVPPTLIPTIDPALVPELLSKAFSVQTMEGVNGHKIRQITGWEHGFGAGMWQYSCSGYYWLDKNHLLLYPQAGQRRQALVTDARLPIGVAPQSVIINMDNGVTWLPPVPSQSMSGICDRVYWSTELGILINSEIQNDTSTVSTYTYDGRKLASYPGSLADISPSRTKILVAENTLIDLRTDKKFTLAWSLEDYNEFILSELFWSSDETRIYRCCYFYADLTTGTSHRFERSDFYLADGTHLDPDGLWFYRGGWVRNDTYFLTEWSYVDDGDIRYLPMFDPAKKLIYDVREMAGISDELTCPETRVSTKGTYVWLSCYDKSYLINLLTFETNEYPGYPNLDMDWSPDDRFAWLQSYESEPKQYLLLSLSNKELTSLPVSPASDPNRWWQDLWWHPVDDVFAYISKDGQKLGLMDARTMSAQELPLSTTFREPVWSPNGDRIALIAENGSLWRVDYPSLENLEQLTPSLTNVYEVKWSPDGNSISFISGSDIYIVDTAKK